MSKLLKCMSFPKDTVEFIPFKDHITGKDAYEIRIVTDEGKIANVLVPRDELLKALEGN